DPDMLPGIDIPFANPEHIKDGKFMPYLRDDKLSRPWAVPGKKGFEHRIGGLSKENETGNVSYDPENNQLMVELREQKVENIAEFIPEISIKAGVEKGDILVLGWGSTYGALMSAVTDCHEQGLKVGFTHLRYLRPFPGNLEKVMSQYQKILIPELNNGQLIKIIREKFKINAFGMNKVQGLPFTKNEIINKIQDILKSD
ncbi:MAG: hypothetical protein PVH48_03045, partial [Cyclobacteriaceae bacterium]